MEKYLLTAVSIALLGGGLPSCSAQVKPGASVPGDLVFADLVPGDAVVALSIPDLKRAQTGWKASALYQIWSEPEVQTFLGKPLSKVPSQPELISLLSKLDAIEARNFFISLVSINTDKPLVVAGFAFKGDAAALETLLAKPKAELKKKYPDGKTGTIPFGHRTIETFDAKDVSLASLVTGGWYFIASDVSQLKNVLDRLDAKGDAPPSLAKDADFKSSVARVPAPHDALTFVRARPILDKIFALAAATGKAIPDTQRQRLEKIRAVVATTGFEKEKLRDTVFILAPGLKTDAAPLALKSLPFTSPETLLFLTAAVTIPEESDLAAADPMGQISKSFADAGFNLKDVRAAVGSESAVQLDWSNGALYPSPVFSVELKDRPTALKLLAAATAKPPKDSEWLARTDDGVEYRILTAKKPGTPIAPTLAVTGTHFLAGISQVDVRGAIARAKGNGTHLDGTPAYKSAMAEVGKADVSLFYLDTKSVFERLYGLGRSLSPYAQGNKQIEDTVDLEKLPATETVSRHLTPVVWTQRTLEDGILAESTGPLTLNQLVISGLGIGGFAAATYQRATKPPTEPPASSSPAPQATPRSTLSPFTAPVPPGPAPQATPARGLPLTTPGPDEKPPVQPKTGR